MTVFSVAALIGAAVVIMVQRRGRGAGWTLGLMVRVQARPQLIGSSQTAVSCSVVGSGCLNANNARNQRQVGSRVTRRQTNLDIMLVDIELVQSFSLQAGVPGKTSNAQHIGSLNKRQQATLFNPRSTCCFGSLCCPVSWGIPRRDSIPASTRPYSPRALHGNW